MKPVFVDTGAFVAIVDDDDRHHSEATKYLRALARKGVRLVTSTYVLDEALTMIRRHVGHRAAVEFGERANRAAFCQIVEVDASTREAAWEIFVRYEDQQFSFTDCTSFAIMRSMALTDAFTFDRADFGAAGFMPRP